MAGVTNSRHLSREQTGLHLPPSRVTGESIAKVLQGNIDFKETVEELQASVKNANSSYRQYKKNNSGNEKTLTEKAFDIVSANPDTAYLFVNPSTKELYSQDGQKSIINTAQKNSAFAEGLSFFEILERGISKGNLMSITKGGLYNEIIAEGKANREVLANQRKAEEEAEKRESMMLSLKLEESRPYNQRSPHTRRRMAEAAVQTALNTKSSNYSFQIKDPGLLKLYENKISQMPGHFEVSGPNANPTARAVPGALQEKVGNLSSLKNNPNLNLSPNEQAKLRGNLVNAETRLDKFNQTVVSNGGRIETGNRQKSEATATAITAAPTQAQATPRKITKPAVAVITPDPIPEKVVGTQFFVNTNNQPIRDIRIGKDEAKVAMIAKKVPYGLKVGEKFNLTEDVSIERIKSDKGFAYNLIFHDTGKYQVGGALHSGNNFGNRSFVVQDKVVAANLPSNRAEVERSVEQVPADVVEAPIRATPQVTAPNQPLPVANVPVAPAPPANLVADRQEKINKSLQELNLQVTFLDQHKHFLTNAEAVQWHGYVDGQQKEIERLKKSGNIEQLEAAIGNTKRNLNLIGAHLEKLKTQAAGYQVQEIWVQDPYGSGKQVKTLNVYRTGNNGVNFIRSEQASSYSFNSQQGNIVYQVYQDQIYAGGSVSYHNDLKQVVTFYSHNFNYKGLNFK